MHRTKTEKRYYLYNRIGHFAYECRIKQGALAVQVDNSSWLDRQSKHFDNQVGYSRNKSQRGQSRGYGSRFNRGRGRGLVTANVQLAEMKEVNGKQENVCGSCSILTPTIT